MIRRTKIVATLGPACSDPTVLRRMILASVDVVRINFSHGTREEHIAFADLTRTLARATGCAVGILAELQGPKIRIARFKDTKVFLNEGQDFALDINLDPTAGDNTQVGITHEPLALEVKPGSRLLLDDGRIVLDVVNVENMRVNCTVVVGGDLSNNKGINLLGGRPCAISLARVEAD